MPGGAEGEGEVGRMTNELKKRAGSLLLCLKSDWHFWLTVLALGAGPLFSSMTIDDSGAAYLIGFVVSIALAEAREMWGE